MKAHADLIFENYNNYLHENNDTIATPQGAIEMLSSEGSFQAYINALTEGLEPYQRAPVLAVCNRQREMLLEEAAQIGPSASIIGYAVTYFPILADIYADPVLAQAVSTYPTSKGIISVPKVEITGSVTMPNGSVSTYKMPRATQLARGAQMDIALAPATTNNLFTLSGNGAVTSTTTRINKRYFMITTVDVHGTNAGGAHQDSTTLVSVNLRPDARGQLHKEFTVTDENGLEASATLTGNVNWDTGVLVYNVLFDSDVTQFTWSVAFANSKVVYSPRTSEIGRVKVQTKLSNWDVDIDTRDDFEIELDTETIQDYKDIYNIDLVRTMSEVIKTQILLNKD